MVESNSAAAVSFYYCGAAAGKTEATVQTLHFTVLPVLKKTLVLQEIISQPI